MARTIQTRKFKEGKMKELRNVKGSYRNYEYKLITKSPNEIASGREKNRQIYRKSLYQKIEVRDFPSYESNYICVYIRLKPQDYYLDYQDMYYPEEPCLETMSIEYDEWNPWFGSGRWIGWSYCGLSEDLGSQSYLTVIEHAKRQIDEIIELGKKWRGEVQNI